MCNTIKFDQSGPINEPGIGLELGGYLEESRMPVDAKLTRSQFYSVRPFSSNEHFSHPFLPRNSSSWGLSLHILGTHHAGQHTYNEPRPNFNCRLYNGLLIHETYSLHHAPLL